MHLARLTGNASWLRAAHLFERTCLVGALALAGQLHVAGAAAAAPPPADGADSDFELAAAEFDLSAARGAAEAAQSERALRGMHANGNIAYVQGAAARCDTRGCAFLLCAWRPPGHLPHMASS